MPFAVFRRHEKKLLAIFAILAMIGFVLSDSLPSLLSREGRWTKGDAKVAELYGKTVHRSDLAQVDTERRLANGFLANLFAGRYPQFFGETTTRALVDALILQHEANRLGIAGGREVGKQWLEQITGGQMNAEMFDALVAPFRSQNVTGDYILEAVGNQVRLNVVRNLPGPPEVTPLDVFRAYRDRYEKVAARAVAVPVDDFLKEVPEPSQAVLAAYYDRYKDLLPDPDRDTPGFKVPRLVRVEYAAVDGAKLAEEFRSQLTERDYLTSYEQRKPEFALEPLLALPTALFVDDPEAKRTPPPARPELAAPEVRPDEGPRYRPFAEVRPIIEADLVQERVREAVEARFEPVGEAMRDFADAYDEAVQDNKEAPADAARKPLPARPDLAALAKKQGLTLLTSPSLTREQAEALGPIAEAHVGLTPRSEGRPFAEEVFSSQSVFEPIELCSPTDQYYLVWKVADEAPRVPPLEEIRQDVIRAWKREQARGPARRAAEALAEKARKAGGTLTAELASPREVVTTDLVSKREAAPVFAPGQFLPPEDRPTEIPQIPRADDALRDALFDLQPGQVVVAPDAPKTTYYVLSLAERVPVDYEKLYSPQFGPYMSIQTAVAREASERRQEQWMAELRARAGLPADWAPPDEDEEKASRRTG